LQLRPRSEELALLMGRDSKLLYRPAERGSYPPHDLRLRNLRAMPPAIDLLFGRGQPLVVLRRRLVDSPGHLGEGEALLGDSAVEQLGKGAG
jgi:hypothetical protein